jgi:hypothetical protein
MVVIGNSDFTVTIVADKVYMRLFQLLLTGNTMSECVGAINGGAGREVLTVADGLAEMKHFALALQPYCGFIYAKAEPEPSLDSFVPTPETTKQ